MYDNLCCFKQLPVNFTLILLPQQRINGVRLLSDVAGGLIVSSDSLLDFHDEIYFVCYNVLLVQTPDNFEYHLLENDFSL